jgi:hypothetical protein
MASLEDVEIRDLPVTRGAFIFRGALAAGAIYGASAVAPFVSQAFGVSGGHLGLHAGENVQNATGAADVGKEVSLLNFALLLEYLESDFYRIAPKQARLSARVRSAAGELGDQEHQHVQALRAVIKGLNHKPIKRPRFTFPFSDQAGFLALAETLEDTGVGAYNGAGPQVYKNKTLLKAAGKIVQIEGRHAAVIRMLKGDPPAPNAFDAALKVTTVRGRVSPFIRKS